MLTPTDLGAQWSLAQPVRYSSATGVACTNCPSKQQNAETAFADFLRHPTGTFQVEIGWTPGSDPLFDTIKANPRPAVYEYAGQTFRRVPIARIGSLPQVAQEYVGDGDYSIYFWVKDGNYLGSFSYVGVRPDITVIRQGILRMSHPR